MSRMDRSMDDMFVSRNDDHSTSVPPDAPRRSFIRGWNVIDILALGCGGALGLILMREIFGNVGMSLLLLKLIVDKFGRKIETFLEAYLTN